jgi:beta-N-acetylhexosaminidase
VDARAVIFGCAGPRLEAREREFFARVRPWGFILFRRNCEAPAQVSRLVADLRAAAGRPTAPVLIDQEGGRVQRLGPPHWRQAPAAAVFGRLAERDPDAAVEACRLNARLLAAELEALGIDVDCLPCLDVRQADGHDVIGDRAFGHDPALVRTLGAAVAAGLGEGGVLPVMKHIPGHGRALVDSHLKLPRVEAGRRALDAVDFAPFKALAALPMAMTAHVVYAAVDPERPATTSAKVVSEVIRNHIGFDGLLLSDDISMRALAGDVATRTRAALAAGCDIVLHCNGRIEEMQAVAAAVDDLGGAAAARAAAALARRSPARAFDRSEAEARLASLLAPLGTAEPRDA